MEKKNGEISENFYGHDFFEIFKEFPKKNSARGKKKREEKKNGKIGLCGGR